MRYREVLTKFEICGHGGFTENTLKEYGVKRIGKEPIDFSVNTNPWGPPISVVKALKEAERHINKYPDSESYRLKAVIAKKYKIDEENIIVGAGITELLILSALAFIEQDTRVLIPKHTYGEYNVAARIMGGIPHFIDMPNLNISAEILTDSLRKNSVMFICNPNNPTGQYLGEEDIKMLVETAEDTQALIIFDEAYIDFINKPFATHKLASKSKNVVVLRSLTKFYSIPGIRIGYAIASNDNIQTLRKVKPPWNVNVFAQYAGIAVLEDSKFLKSSLKKISESKLEFEKNLPVRSSAANFYILDVGNAKLVTKKLLKNGIFVRDCSSFSLPAYIRFSVRKPYQNKKLVDALYRLGFSNL